MRTTHFFYYMLLILGVTGMMYCGSGDTTTTETSGADTAAVNTDSTMSAHNRDPSVAYPEPPVSGTNIDSSRTKDSTGKKDTTHKH